MPKIDSEKLKEWAKSRSIYIRQEMTEYPTEDRQLIEKIDQLAAEEEKDQVCERCGDEGVVGCVTMGRLPEYDHETCPSCNGTGTKPDPVLEVLNELGKLWETKEFSLNLIAPYMKLNVIRNKIDALIEQRQKELEG